MFEKNKIKFDSPFDFNSLSQVINSGHFISQVSSQVLADYVLHSSFQIKKVQSFLPLNSLYNFCENEYNTKRKPSDLDIFFSMQSGVKSSTHRDAYDVIIIGAFGRTLYKVEDKEFLVEPGDLLYIPATQLHVAIGLDPRIIFSYGMH